MASITEEMIDAEIRGVQYHHFPGTQLIVCCLTLKNGFSVAGTANAHNPSAFNLGMGHRIAMEQARDKVAPLISYAIRSRLHRAKMPELRVREMDGSELRPIRDAGDTSLEFGDGLS